MKQQKYAIVLQNKNLDIEFIKTIYAVCFLKLKYKKLIIKPQRQSAVFLVCCNINLIHNC